MVTSDDEYGGVTPCRWSSDEACGSSLVVAIPLLLLFLNIGGSESFGDLPLRLVESGGLNNEAILYLYLYSHVIARYLYPFNI